jgi:ribosomal protein S18 acetylase RimI-like enzyme
MPAGALRLRDEQSGDADFLFALFAANNAMMSAPVPPAMRDALIATQHRSQTASYRRDFATADFLIVEWSGVPIGRIVAHRGGEFVHIVDLALLPAHRHRGFGTALVRAFMDEAAGHGLGVSAAVLMNNTPSLGLFRKLGFSETASAGAAHIDVRWSPRSSGP